MRHLLTVLPLLTALPWAEMIGRRVEAVVPPCHAGRPPLTVVRAGL